MIFKITLFKKLFILSAYELFIEHKTGYFRLSITDKNCTFI